MRNLLLCLSFLLSLNLDAITPQEMHSIAEKIWKNECAGTIEGLTTWNKGENFGSFGIGHFIWYPTDKKGPFEETFPELLAFLQKKGAILPKWISQTSTCPWKSREEFYQEISSLKMNELRQFLLDTKDLQASFIAERLERTFPLLIEKLGDKREAVKRVFTKLSRNSRGLYALIDYLNFKGAGTSSKETYRGEGWGLLQVLQKIPDDSSDVVMDFVEAAKAVLIQRVKNSPPDRGESRWLQGWINRVETYTKK